MVRKKSHLFVASLSDIAYGPPHTFQSSDTRTTIDYIMLGVSAASLLESCGTLEDDDLNTSDHLLQLVQLEFPCQPNDSPVLGKIRIDWSKVESSCVLHTYHSEISTRVTPFLGCCHDSIDCLNEEVELLANNIKSAAEMTLPTIQLSKKGKKSHFCKDSTLKHLCIVYTLQNCHPYLWRMGGIYGCG